MSGPVDDSLPDIESNGFLSRPIRTPPVPPDAILPEVFRGRMFCVIHGRQCYRSRTVVGEYVWICPDERHFTPLA